MKTDLPDMLNRWVRGDKAVWCLCFTVAFCAATFASADSPFTHTTLGHTDTAWFLDAGRWMMQGLTPYEDFADSKGPLLWLFFGLGYLLDNDGWTGMFVLFALYSVFVYRYVWLSAIEMLGSRKAAAFVVLFMPLVFLSFGHKENRAEYLFQLPLAYFIYLVIRAFKGHEITRLQYILTGVAMGCMLFVKWNFPAMLLPLPVIMLCYDARRHGKIGGINTWFNYAMSRLGLALAGFAVVALCVLALMAALGGLQGMFREYFFNTLNSLQLGSQPSWWHSVRWLQVDKLLFLAILLLFPMTTHRIFGHKGLWLFFAFIWMLFVCFFHYMPYYRRAIDAFGLFVPIAIIMFIQRFYRLKLWIFLIEIPIVAGCIYYFTCLSHPGFGYNPEGASFFRMCERVDRVERPLILYFGVYDYSLGISSDAKPACRYWASQNGGSAEMHAMQYNTMIRQKADIIVTNKDDFRPEQYGYVTRDDDVFCGPYPKEQLCRVHWSPRVYDQSML